VLAQLQAKELDMWDLATANYYPRLKELQGYDVVQRPSYYWDHLDFNITHPGLNDPVVRKALRLAINRKSQNDRIAHGLFLVTDSPTPQNAPYAVKVGDVPYDPDQANKMLDQDGWKLGPDGIRSKNGVKLSFNFATTAGSPDADNRIELIRSDWKKIGVAFSVQHYPPAMMFAPLQEGGIVYGNKWDMISFAWQNEAIGDYSQIYGCDAFPPKGQNVPRWCSQKAETAMTALYGKYDQPQRNPEVKTFADEFINDVPVIVTDQRVDLYAVNKDLKNFQPNSITPFDNFMDVDI
jgi:peptide/nickel transport system substrate-binding protein